MTDMTIKSIRTSILRLPWPETVSYTHLLSCADSRIAPEYCFDTARGDVFVCRIAGNFASDEMVASLEYAVQVLNTPLIVVLGHDSCGAVDATIKSVRAVSYTHLDVYKRQLRGRPKRPLRSTTPSAPQR